MDLLISTNYNISEEKWSIVVKYGEKIKAISLERLAKIKHFPSGKFFGKKNYYKLFILGLKKLTKEVDFEKIEKIFVINFPFSLESIFKGKKIEYIESDNHHLLHAFSSFYSSGFDKATVVVVDGAGYEGQIKKEICYSIWNFEENKYNNLYFGETKKDDFKIGVGFMYALHTLIFKMGEGAIMGLSSYGDATFYNNIDFFGQDFFLKQEYRDIFKKYENNGNNLKDLEEVLKEIYGIKNERNNLDYIHNNHKHIASRLQFCTQKAITNLAEKAIELSGNKNLCIAGGVGLNIITNTLISNKKNIDNLFIDPVCEDAGLALGGIYYLESLKSNLKSQKIDSYSLGEIYKDLEIENECKKYKSFLKYSKNKDILSISSNLLNEGKIIGFFQGGSEFGPRALGFRSILARPDSLTIRNRINNIKLREYWRPLAPVIIESELENYFHTKQKSSFMLLNGQIKINKFKNMIGVSHVDFTARYQTLNIKNNKFLYELLNFFYQKSGIPILINTSFNQHNQPIVESPKDAIEMFLSTNLDYLVIGNYIVEKEKIYKQYGFSKDKIYENLFNQDNKILKKLDELISLENRVFKSFFYHGEIKFKSNNKVFSLRLVEYNVIGNKKNILINFEDKFDEEKNIIKKIKLHKKLVSKLLLLYYNDFLEPKDVENIEISHNNFKL